MPQRYQPLSVRSHIESKLNDMNECRSNQTAWETIRDKPAFVKNQASTKAHLESITPPDTTSADKQKIAIRAKALQEAMINGNSHIPPMPAEDQMQLGRAQDVDQHMTWEGFWKKHTLGPDNKSIISINPQNGQRGGVWELKDALRTLKKDAEADRPNIANLETMRPRDSHPPLADVPSRSYALSWAARANYDEVFPDHNPTPVEQKLQKEV